MKKILLLLLLSGVWGTLRAGAPSPVRDTAGVVRAEFVYDRAEFPSCHAATIVETSRGELMIALFGGKYESNADCSIWASHLHADGWETPRLVADGLIDSVKTACWNPVLFQMPGGELLLFYKVGRNVQDWSGWLIRSQDGGYSWSAPERLPDGFLGPIKNKPLLWGDRLLCGTSLERGGWRAYLEVTDTAVTRWESIGPLNDRRSRTQIIQPSLVARPDGSLQALCRAIDLRGNIISLTSRDGGRTWDEPRSTGLPNNDSGLDAVALRDGRLLLVYNHIEAVKSGAAARSPINVALSDDGRNWYAALTLEDSPGDEYSYPSVIQSSDGLVHIVYTWHRSCIKHVVLDPARLSIDPRRRIVDEHWVEPLPPDARRWEACADSLLAQMTPDERLGCLAGHWRPHDRGTHDLLAGGVKRLGIPDFRMEFALEGVHTNGKSTLYPSPLALAATFDSTLVAAVGRSIAAARHHLRRQSASRFALRRGLCRGAHGGRHHARRPQLRTLVRPRRCGGGGAPRDAAPHALVGAFRRSAPARRHTGVPCRRGFALQRGLPARRVPLRRPAARRPLADALDARSPARRGGHRPAPRRVAQCRTSAPAARFGRGLPVGD